MSENEAVAKVARRGAGRTRRVDSDDDEVDSTDSLRANVPASKPVSHVVRKAPPAKHVPAATLSDEGADAATAEHADPNQSLNTDAAEVTAVAERDLVDTKDDENGVADETASRKGAGGAVVVDDLFELDYDKLGYDALLQILHTIPSTRVAEVKAEREQAAQMRRQRLMGQRVERFLDLPVGQSSSSDVTASHKEGYSYLTMLNRLYEALNLNHENSAIKERNQVPVPAIEKIGKKKTVITNFGRICNAFNRPMEDVKDFIEKELSIRGNLDSNDALILKYEIRKATDFDRILIKYLDEFVKCNSCHRIDTTLTKDGRHTELRCNFCTATRTVQAVGSAAFSAQVEKRSRQRAAAAMTLS